MTAKLFFSLAFTLLIFVPLRAMDAQSQTQGGEMPRLSLKNALESSLKNSARVSIGKQKVIEKASLRMGSRSSFLPRLSLNISGMDATRNLKAQGVSFPGAPDKVGPFSTFDTRLTFNETLLNLSLLNQVYAAGEETRVAELELSQAESDLFYQTTVLFLNTRRNESAVQADQANVDLSEELLKFAEHQKSSGIGTILDVTRARVKLAEDRQRLIITLTQKSDAILALQKQIGVQQGDNLSLDDHDLTSQDFPDLKESIQTALLKRKEVAIQSQRERIKEIQFKAAFGEKYPSINLFADYGEIGNGVTDAFPTHTFGITLNLPLYDGQNRKAKEDAVMSQLRQEQFKTRESASQIELEVRQIYNDLNAVRKQLEVVKERLSLAEKELLLAQHRFENGIGTHIELVATQTSLTEAREALVEAQFQVQGGIVKYYYVTGQMDYFFSQLP
ncbi:MAG: TolC family protein [Nitrospirae bacterium]|nr:TolC family protein [Nitrospirota bacterium]